MGVGDRGGSNPPFSGVLQPKSITNQILSEVSPWVLDHKNTKVYQIWRGHTLKENHGKTAMYWMQYIELMHLCHKFARSIRAGVIDAYIGCKPKFSNYFFHSEPFKLFKMHFEISQKEPVLV